jgi:hypothetical protein
MEGKLGCKVSYFCPVEPLTKAFTIYKSVIISQVILLPGVFGALVVPCPISPLSNHTQFPYSHVLSVPSILGFAAIPSVLEVSHILPGIHLSPSVVVPSSSRQTLFAVLDLTGRIRNN